MQYVLSQSCEEDLTLLEALKSEGGNVWNYIPSRFRTVRYVWFQVSYILALNLISFSHFSIV